MSREPGEVHLAPFVYLIYTPHFVRRYHDLGYSGFYYLLNLIPLVPIFVFIYLCFAKGTSEDNEYGPPGRTKIKSKNKKNLDNQINDPTNINNLNNRTQSIRLYLGLSRIAVVISGLFIMYIVIIANTVAPALVVNGTAPWPVSLLRIIPFSIIHEAPYYTLVHENEVVYIKPSRVIAAKNKLANGQTVSDRYALVVAKAKNVPLKMYFEFSFARCLLACLFFSGATFSAIVFLWLLGKIGRWVIEGFMPS